MAGPTWMENFVSWDEEAVAVPDQSGPKFCTKTRQKHIKGSFSCVAHLSDHVTSCGLPNPPMMMMMINNQLIRILDRNPIGSQSFMCFKGPTRDTYGQLA